MSRAKQFFKSNFLLTFLVFVEGCKLKRIYHLTFIKEVNQYKVSEYQNNQSY